LTFFNTNADDQEILVSDLSGSSQIEIVIPHPQPIVDSAALKWIPTCRFWDHANSVYDASGCSVKEFNLTHTICQCTHLTDFNVQLSRFKPSITPLGDDDFRNLTWSNLRDH